MEPFTTVLRELSEKLILKIFEGCNNPPEDEGQG